MSRNAFVIEEAGLNFKVSGVVDIHDAAPVSDLSVQAIFADEDDQVLVDVPDEFLDELYVQNEASLDAEFIPLREQFERIFLRQATKL